MTKLLIIAILTGCLLGCASSSKQTPIKSYYVLDGAVALPPEKKGLTVKLDRISLAEYLNQSSLITRQNGQTISPARYHHWAESLPSLLHRSLKSELNLGSHSTLFVDRCSSNCPVISVSVDHFYPTEEGEVILAGDYSITELNSDDSSSIAFLYKSNLSNDGYEHAVRELKAHVVSLAKDINKHLEKIHFND